MDAFTKDVIQVLSWIIAALVGLVAAFKAIRELAASRLLRTEELRWKKAHLAREVLTRHLENPLFRDALTMLDYTDREYKTAHGDTFTIAWEDFLEALRPWEKGDPGFYDKDVYIRDCFDAMLDGFEIFEHYLRTGLLEFEDVRFPMAYWIKKLKEHRVTVERYIDHYFGSGLTLAFIKRFQEPNHRSD